MRKRKYGGGRWALSIIKFFRENRPRTEFDQLNSVEDLDHALHSTNGRSIALALFPSEMAVNKSTLMSDFTILANAYS